MKKFFLILCICIPTTLKKIMEVYNCFKLQRRVLLKKKIKAKNKEFLNSIIDKHHIFEKLFVYKIYIYHF